jgi:hypothetical protein
MPTLRYETPWLKGDTLVRRRRRGGHWYEVLADGSERPLPNKPFESTSPGCTALSQPIHHFIAIAYGMKWYSLPVRITPSL